MTSELTKAQIVHDLAVAYARDMFQKEWNPQVLPEADMLLLRSHYAFAVEKLNAMPDDLFGWEHLK